MLAVPLALFFFATADPFQSAVAHYNHREYAKAAEEFQQILKTEPADTPTYRQSTLFLAQSLYLNNQFKDAIPYLEKAAAAGNKTLEANYMLGNAHIQLHETEAAAKAFAGLFGVPADSASAYLLTAQMMIRRGFEEDAEQAAKHALELNPLLPQGHFVLGEITILHGDLDRAIAELTKEIQLNPNFAMAYYRLADAHTRREQWDEAIPLLEKSIWLNPAYSGPYILLGKGYLRRRDLGNAENLLKQAIKIDPQNSSAHYLLGQTLAQQGRTEEAKKLMDRSQQLKTGNQPER